jgi:hypothetical protein
MKNLMYYLAAAVVLLVGYKWITAPKSQPATTLTSEKSETTKPDTILNAETAKLLSDAEDAVNEAEKMVAYSAVSMRENRLNDPEIKKQLTGFRIKNDEFEQMSWYRPKSSPLYTNANGIYLYFGVSRNALGALRLRMQYYADDWLFIKSVTFLIDGKPYDLYTGSFERDNEGGMIWEWYDQPVIDGSEEIVEALLNCKSAKIRYQGKQYYNDKKISESQIAAIRSTHKLYMDLR